MKVYIGCSLTKASDDFKSFVASFKADLGNEPGIELLEFIGLVAGTPADVYRVDLDNVRTCDVFIAFVDEPAIGLGMELHEAIQNEKPILCLHRNGVAVTRMLLGARDAGHLAITTYDDAASALAAARAFLAERRTNSAAVL